MSLAWRLYAVVSLWVSSSDVWSRDSSFVRADHAPGRDRRAVHQARLERCCYIRALRSLYKPCEDGDFREECTIILQFNWTQEHAGEPQPRRG